VVRAINFAWTQAKILSGERKLWREREALRERTCRRVAATGSGWKLLRRRIELLSIRVRR
jgi:hypothetical protein